MLGLRTFIILIVSIFYLIGMVEAAQSGRRTAIVRALDTYEQKQAQAVRSLNAQGRSSAKASEYKPIDPNLVARKMAEKLFSFEMGFETYSYKYEETVGGNHFMDLEGTFSGIYTKLIWRPDMSGESYWKSYIDHFIMDVRMGWAKLDYDGGIEDDLGNSFPAVSSDSPNRVIELRGLMAKDFAFHSWTVTPYAGFGYRHLTDDQTEQNTIVFVSGEWFDIGPVGGYKRKSDYYYLPFGVELARPLGDKWTMGMNAELDYLFYGEQLSKTEITGEDSGGNPLSFPNITNEQNEGFGLRTSLRFVREVGNRSFSIEPFYRYWNIEDSDLGRWDQGQTADADIDWVGGGIEPSNVTSEFGMKMGMIF